VFPTAIASSAPRLPVRARPPPNTSLTAGFALALPSRQIFNAFCSRKALQPDAVRFLFDGSRINPNQTPKDLDMEDGDSIDAMMEQVGGH